MAARTRGRSSRCLPRCLSDEYDDVRLGLEIGTRTTFGRAYMATPRGKVIGGSSSINGMVYVRGHAMDFDHWADSGAQGWGYADVLPYFKRMENWHAGGHGGDHAWRGNDGPLHVTRGPRKNPLTRPLSRRAGRRVSESPATTTASSKRALARWSRPSGRAGAGPPPTPICGLR